MNSTMTFPRQALSDKRKGKKWQEQCMRWGDSMSYMHYSPVRKSVRHKKINYDLINGKLHMDDVVAMLNPMELDQHYFPDAIQHFPIMNSKLGTLIGEELQRPFDWRAIVTNPNAVSSIEREKQQAMQESLREMIEDESYDEDSFMNKMEELSTYFEFDYQDFREVRANEVIKHWGTQYNFPLMFNNGFKDGLIVGEEVYFCDIVGGNPYIERVNPLKLRVYRSGSSNKIEDADIIIIEDYWAPGRIIDVYGDSLSEKDIQYIDTMLCDNSVNADSMDNIDPAGGLIDRNMVDDTFVDNGQFFWDPEGGPDGTQSMLPYDSQGNVRVLRMFWKSRRKIKKVKMYDPETGEEYFDFFAENFTPDENLGEESEPLWINEAWEGTMIGGHLPANGEVPAGLKAILVNVRPRPVQYLDMDNPSKCFLGFVGTIYNLNDDRPYSMVDMMKPFNYLYDVIHFKLMDAIASVWGSLVDVDLATIPEKWKVEQWMYFARINHIAVRDSFREGRNGKIAGALNNNQQRIINDTTGNYIQELMNLAAYIKQELGEMVGITRQREGQVANRETVGGVERSVLQSSYITEWYFATHNDTKRRTIEMFIETAKIAFKGRKISFRYKLSDGSWKLMEFDGDEFAENCYGILVDGSSDVKNLDQKLESAAQAGMQRGTVTLSALMKIWTSALSLEEKIKIIEKSEKDTAAQAERAQQQQAQMQQAVAQAQLEQKQIELQTKAAMNSEDNETKILIAQMDAENKLRLQDASTKEDDGIPTLSPDVKAKLDEQIREFNLNLRQDDKRIALEKERNEIARINAEKRTSK